MKAIAAVWALHTTITSEKVTAHAQGKTVCLIGTKEFVWPHRGHRHWQQQLGGCCAVGRSSIVQLTGEHRPICHHGEFPANDTVALFFICIPPLKEYKFLAKETFMMGMMYWRTRNVALFWLCSLDSCLDSKQSPFPSASKYRPSRKSCFTGWQPCCRGISYHYVRTWETLQQGY